VDDGEMEWHHFPPGLEAKVLTANLYSAYEVRCGARGGEEICPSHRNCSSGSGQPIPRRLSPFRW
jgi:hypothetical protein